MSTTHEQGNIDTSSDARYGASRRVTLVSVVWNLILTVAQIIIGFVGHSQALIADGLHTLSDFITDFMVLFALKHGRKDADQEHPYGHARIETAVTMILGIILVAVGAGIAISAGIRLASAQTFVIPSAMTLWIAVITLGAKEGLYRYTMVVADRFDSNMLRANAWHHRSDALSSLIVAAGIGGSLLGFGYLDSVAALIVALMVVKVGGELAWQSLRELIDTGLAAEDLESIRRVILSISGVKALHLLRTRRVGEQALADVMVHIDTEEDVNVPSGAELPLRDELQKRLNNYFRDIPEARLIEHMTLHYLNGRIDIELLLSQGAVTHSTTARQLAQRFTATVRDDRDIGKVDVYYH